MRSRKAAQAAKKGTARGREAGREGEGKDVRNLAQKSITSDEKRESEIH